MSQTKILIIEDDKVILRFLKLALETNEYDVVSAMNGLSGISLYLSHKPDLVLLDLGLPDIDGMEVLSQIRESDDTPVIVISARSKEQEKVLALDSGANDYVTKPFNMGEVLARIRVSLRKVNPSFTQKELFSFKDLQIDFEKRLVLLAEEEIHLTPMEYKLLTLLVEHQGKVLTHSFLQKKVWGYDTLDEYQSLRVFMASIRKKIEQSTKDPEYIVTEVGVGYRFLDH